MIKHNKDLIYFGDYCDECETPIICYSEPHREKVPFLGQGKVLLTCPNCHHQNDHLVGQLKRFQIKEVD